MYTDPIYSEKLWIAIQKHFLPGSGGVGGVIYGVKTHGLFLNITLQGITDAVIYAAIGSLVGILIGEVYKGVKSTIIKLVTKHHNK